MVVSNGSWCDDIGFAIIDKSRNHWRGFMVKVEGWYEGFTVNVARRSEGLVVDIEFAVDGGHRRG